MISRTREGALYRTDTPRRRRADQCRQPGCAADRRREPRM